MVTGSVSKIELEWDDVFSGKLPESPARQAWREAVTVGAEKAKAALPEANGRIDAAVKLVLAGDVELVADNTAKVASQSNGSATYRMVNGACDCKDFAKAPGNFCKHRLAYGIAKRATTLAKQYLEQLDGMANGHQATAQPPEQGRLVVPLNPIPPMMSVVILVLHV